LSLGIKRKADINGKPYNYNYLKIRNCKTCGKKLHAQSKTGFCKEHYITDEVKLKRSKIAKTNNFGGYKPGSGRGLHGWYKGYWCDSTWELAFVIFNLEHNISFKRNSTRFEYYWENKKHYWIPDFLINDTFIEIKGFANKQTLSKFSNFKLPLRVLYKKGIRTYFKICHRQIWKGFS